jgi:hypothetical protein
MNTTFKDWYPTSLDHEAERHKPVDADGGRYRRILRRLAVAGLPERVDVGDVSVSFTEGPVRTQRTTLRQRPGSTFVFDKHMDRGVEVGHGEFLTILELPVALDEGMAIDAWRARVDVALGLLIVTLDERIAGTQIAEDVILFRAGIPIAAAEQVSHVRSFMPFEVNAADRAALSALAGVDLDETTGGSRAAGLYAAASVQGPSRLGFLLMWLSVDAVVYEGRNQVRELRQALAASGFVEAWLSMPVGRLAGLRGNVAHGKPESDALVYDGYYDVEAIARVLIAHAGGVERAWPSSPTIRAFRPHIAAVLGPAVGEYREVWHADDLPPARAAAPDPALPDRYDAVLDGHSAWIQIDSPKSLQSVGQIRWAVWQALLALSLEVDELTITITDEHAWGPENNLAVGAHRLLLSPAHPTAFATEPDGGLVLEFCQALAQQQVMRLGVPPNDAFGAFLIELAGAWAMYATTKGEYAPDLPDHVDADADLAALGPYIGYSVAGDERSNDALNQFELEGNDQTVVALIREVRSTLTGVRSLDDILAYVRSLTSAADADRAKR